MKVGIPVFCAVCGCIKKPRGRSAPMGARYCDPDCSGYSHPPYPGDLWPGESDEDFGFSVSSHATRSVTP